MSPHPPRLAAWIVSRIRPSDAELILGDLEEEWAAEVRRRGRHAATLWYWNLSLRSLAARSGGVRSMNEPQRFGGLSRVLEMMRQNLAHSWRSLVRAPAFSLIVVVTLALGIGSSVAVFSLVRSVLLRSLPHPQSERLMLVGQEDDQGRFNWVSWPNYLDWAASVTTFDALVAISWPSESTVMGAGEAVRVPVMAVSADYWSVFGVRPVLGRVPTHDEHVAGGRPVAVVSQGFYDRALNAPRSLDGVTIRIDDAVLDVIGVLPASFRTLDEAVEIWLPIEDSDATEHARGAHMLRVVGRVGPGRTQAQAAEEIDAISTRLGERYESETRMRGARLVSVLDWMVGGARRQLMLLLAGGALVLLIACTNAAGVTIARGILREREYAVRASLGANRGRLVANLFTESVLLATAAAAIGLLVWTIAQNALRDSGQLALPRAGEVRVDALVVGFAFLAALCASVIAGLIPALQASSVGAATILRSGGRGSTGDRRALLWRSLVATQVALALVLLVSAGLLVRSLANVLGADTGYSAEGRLVARVSIPPSRFSDDALLAAHITRSLEEVGSVPGVRAAGVTTRLPVRAWDWTGPFQLADGTSTLPFIAGTRAVDAGYFRALDVRLLSGRLFDPAVDRAEAPPVVVINESLAHQFWPDANPIGQEIRLDDRPHTIIGVVAEMRHWRNPPGQQPEIYRHYVQAPGMAGSIDIVMDARDDLENVVPLVRERLTALAPDIPAQLVTMQSVVGETVRDRTFTMGTLVGFASVAFVIALVGVYGVISNAVARRTREIGVRVALGARPAAVRRMVRAHALAVVGTGLVIGAVASFAFTGIIRSQLFGVSADDPFVFGATVLLLLAGAWVAASIPARRATRIDPMQAMRMD